MAKHSVGWWVLLQKRWLLALLIMFSISTVITFFIRVAFDPYDHLLELAEKLVNSVPKISTKPSPLSFMKSKLILLVSPKLSLSGGPLLLMELAFLLRDVGSEVYWMTIQKRSKDDEVIYSLEHKMLNRGVQIVSAKGQEVVSMALKTDLIVLNTAIAGKWLDVVVEEAVPHVLPKVLWWIHEMRGHYFKPDYVKHLSFVAGAMIDSHVTVEYWKTKTQE